MTKTKQILVHYKEQKEEIRKWKNLSERYHKEQIEANKEIKKLRQTLHILKSTPWWKIRTFTRVIKQLRRS